MWRELLTYVCRSHCNSLHMYYTYMSLHMSDVCMSVTLQLSPHVLHTYVFTHVWRMYVGYIATLSTCITHVCLYTSIRYITLHIYDVCPPAPMNHVKNLRAGPAEMPFQNWYTANTNHFHLTDSVRWKWKTQPDWVINPVTHDLVRRIRFWRKKISGTWF